MSRRPPPKAGASSLSLRLGRWIEASATGWGLVALPVVLALVLAAWLLFAR